MSKIFHTEYLYNGIFFLYIFFLTSTISNAGLSISLALLLLLLITLFIKKRMNIPMPNTTYLILYSIFFGGLIFVSFFSPSSQSKYFTLKYFYWTLPFWVVYLYIIEIPSFISWGRALATSLLILMSKAFFQFFLLPLGTRITSFFYSGNGFAAVLELVIPFLLIYFIECKKRNYWVESKLIALIIVLSLCGLLGSQSRGGIAGWCIGGVLLFLVRYCIKSYKRVSLKKTLSIIIATAAIISSIVFLGYHTFHRGYDYERTLMIQSSYEMWSDHKMFGVGFENWGAQYKHYVSPTSKERNVPMPHNNIAYFFSATGTIGGISYFVYVFGVLFLLICNIRKCPNNLYYQAALWSFLAITVHGMVDSGITNKFSMQILSACLGITFSSEYVNTSQLKKEENDF